MHSSHLMDGKWLPAGSGKGFNLVAGVLLFLKKEKGEKTNIYMLI